MGTKAYVDVSKIKGITLGEVYSPLYPDLKVPIMSLAKSLWDCINANNAKVAAVTDADEKK